MNRKISLTSHPRLGSNPVARTHENGAWKQWRWRGIVALGSAALLSIASCANPGGQAAPNLEGKPLSGYVDMNQIQAAYIGSGSTGQGTLRYHGQTYPFNVSGLGIGGIGISTIEAKGDVYGLHHLHDFSGAYGQIRYGFALGTKSAGDLWLQNTNGVVLHLKAKREGLMLSLGGDAVVISMNQ